MYYIQPLLNVVGEDFGLSHTAAGLLVTAAQVGYVVGLALLVPLGDLRERNGLISLLIGILGARIVSGIVAQIGGWRLIFALAAASCWCSRSSCGACCRASSRSRRCPIRGRWGRCSR